MAKAAAAKAMTRMGGRTWIEQPASASSEKESDLAVLSDNINHMSSSL